MRPRDEHAALTMRESVESVQAAARQARCTAPARVCRVSRCHAASWQARHMVWRWESFPCNVHAAAWRARSTHEARE